MTEIFYMHEKRNTIHLDRVVQMYVYFTFVQLVVFQFYNRRQQMYLYQLPADPMYELV